MKWKKKLLINSNYSFNFISFQKDMSYKLQKQNKWKKK